MIDDRNNRSFEAPLSPDLEALHGPLGNILDVLDMEGVGDIEIAFERPVRHGGDLAAGLLEQDRDSEPNDDRTGDDQMLET